MMKKLFKIKHLLAFVLICALAISMFPMVTPQMVSANSNIPDNTVYRAYGANRYETSQNVAAMLMENANTSKFTSVVVASGANFADALAGSYLAATVNAPIVLIRSNRGVNTEWFKANVADGANIYILGGYAAVSEVTEASLQGYNIHRLAGANRYGTNLMILQKAKDLGGSTKDILVSTGKEFADSLSASATGKAILLTNKSLTAEQKAFLSAAACQNIYVLGGIGAVDANIEAELAAYGSVKRISGANRYETSVKIAETFFPNAKNAVVAYAKNFPDGLSGGPLAFNMSAPLILTASGRESVASAYTTKLGIHSGVVLGGQSVISDDTAKKIFGIENVKVYQKGSLTPECVHNYSFISDTATCVNGGIRTEACARCGVQRKYTSNPTGHVDVREELQDATCSSGGKKLTICNTCGTVVNSEIIPAKACSYTKTEIITDTVKRFAEQGNYEYSLYARDEDCIVDVCSVCGHPNRDTVRFAYTDYEAAEIMLKYVNDLRTSVYGTTAYNLVLDEWLIETAKVRAKEISTDFSHVGCPAGCGENIAQGGDTIRGQFDMWVDSSGHYQNMIRKGYTNFGYALYSESRKDSSIIFGVQLFY